VVETVEPEERVETFTVDEDTDGEEGDETPVAGGNEN
jgi:hypothetical protein